MVSVSVTAHRARVPSPGSPLGRYLTGLLGPPAEHAGQVLAWRFSPAS